MPIWLRRFHIQKISAHNEAENERMKKAKEGRDINSNPKKIQGPNINPSTTYNY